MSENILTSVESTWCLSIFNGRTIVKGAAPKSLKDTLSLFIFEPFFKPGTTKEGDTTDVIVTTREIGFGLTQPGVTPLGD